MTLEFRNDSLTCIDFKNVTIQCSTTIHTALRPKYHYCNGNRPFQFENRQKSFTFLLKKANENEAFAGVVSKVVTRDPELLWDFLN